MELKILTFNTHKFRNPLNRRYILSDLKSTLVDVDCDLILMQELTGVHPQKVNGTFNGDPLEHLADQLWDHYAYGKNAVSTKGHHGNAIMSRHPISTYHNFNISNHRFEQRGLLHCRIQLDECYPLDIFTAHLDLSQWGRQRQLSKLIPIIERETNGGPFLLAGDFNDWNRSLHSQVIAQGYFECATEQGLPLINTYPSFFPILSLDRIYFRGLKCIEASVLRAQKWHLLSDHLPLFAKFQM